MRESGEAFVGTLGIKHGLKVLDLGCGDGTTALPAAKLGADVSFRELLAGEKPTFQLTRTRPHQQRAVENAIKHFKDGGNARGKLIHPCGSGKSLTAYWISEALSHKTVLIAVPGLYLAFRSSMTGWRGPLTRRPNGCARAGVLL
jgi:superfamily II DNA or RNA helicase